NSNSNDLHESSSQYSSSVSFFNDISETPKTLSSSSSDYESNIPSSSSSSSSSPSPSLLLLLLLLSTVIPFGCCIAMGKLLG
ncbi:unnamed protein product, partial [Rotaria sp. Silwood2]